MASTGLAHAQASRTWVSGVGDDANPCSRTAPCKTFAGAISKTATGGEINTLDAGGFGGVTITKAITIASEGTGEAGVLVSGTNGIVVNAPTGSFVNLRGLQLEGLGTGLSGVLVLSGDVHIDNCVIRNFRGNPGVGVNSQASTASRVTIANSLVMGNQIGVRAAPTATGTGVALQNSSIESNLQYGLLATTTFARFSLDRTSIKGNAIGISAPSPAKTYSFGNNAINSIEAGTVLTSSPLQ
ncbi:right-handed parallel beta-helix repeat-containing protein [Ideonella sp. YS5]|uniref:right-handed parallel beta-helix repeat-containing protein n=1 Tax=Ideonella sp. YS5 TaxID=3453714 RepID=UPI003EEF9690